MWEGKKSSETLRIEWLQAGFGVGGACHRKTRTTVATRVTFAHPSLFQFQFHCFSFFFLFPSRARKAADATVRTPTDADADADGQHT